MSNVEQLTKLIQDAVNGCSKNWAETIAIYLLNRGDYLYGKREVYIDILGRLTDRDVIDKNKELDPKDAPDYEQIYTKLYLYEDMRDKGMLKTFIDIGEEHYEN